VLKTVIGHQNLIMADVQIVPEETDSPLKSKTSIASDYDLEFLQTWGFTLRNTYKLTLRFYKGKIFQN
jgi:hypothetical protein